ncbi:MAG: hypothetical protein KDA89_13790 [Planctomycetaceae bacterium]|nr:hypothetical protein [Planctomycetaceae bacterium]
MSNDVSLTDLRLVSEHRTHVRELKGFLKTHRVPVVANEHSRKFVAGIAAADISDDLDVQFAAFRKHLKVKRVDISVHEAQDGVGTITTPWFEYRLSVTASADDAATVLWRRQAANLRSPELLTDSRLSRIFGTLFDTVEFNPPGPIDLEELIDALEERDDESMSIQYDRSVSWCEVSLKPVPGVLKVETERIALRATTPIQPEKLIEGFIRLRRCLPMPGIH